MLHTSGRSEHTASNRSTIAARIPRFEASTSALSASNIARSRGASVSLERYVKLVAAHPAAPGMFRSLEQTSANCDSGRLTSAAEQRLSKIDPDPSSRTTARNSDTNLVLPIDCSPET